MIKNNLKIAWRKLRKNTLFSGINIAGLTLGMTCFVFILLYVFSQYQYDKHHAAGHQLYRVETELNGADGAWISATVSPPIVPALQTDFPEVVNSTRLVDPPETDHHILEWKGNAYYETKGYYVDSTFFQLFDYAWVEGHSTTALQEPYTVVLTKKVKDKLFGRQSALGQTIRINNRFADHEFKVTGVVDPDEYKSHIQAHFYMAMNSGGMGEYVRNNDQWGGGNFIYGYVELHPSADPAIVETKMADLLQRYGGQELKEMGMEKVLSLQAVPNIHLKSTRNNQLEAAGNLRFLRILMLIGAFILFIACVNFMNLATAKSLKSRAEIGIRKTIGANRKSIARQFYIESFFVSGVSFLLASLLVYLLLLYVPQSFSIPLQPGDLFSPVAVASMLGTYLLTAWVAGSYPAIYLSGFQPVSIIKKHFQKGKGQDNFRKGLVVLQFTIAIGMIIGSMVVLKQLHYMQKKDLGFEVDQKIIIPFLTQEARDHLDAFKKEISQLSGVEQVAGTRVYPGQFVERDFGVYKSGEGMQQSHIVKLVQGDEDYLNTLGIPLLSGRQFVLGDTSLQILINQTALQTLAIPEEEALGQRLTSEYRGEAYTYEVIGVVKDFHQNSLKDPIRPMIFEYRPTPSTFSLIVDVASAKDQGLIASLEAKWNEMVADVPFEYQYLDEHFQQQYLEEQQLAQLIYLFTFIAIFISCLGLFGLSVFIAEQRTKEIGIRKVLGASVTGIVGLLSKGFVKLILLALVIATPVAWYAMSDWLNHFAYRVPLDVSVFVWTGIAVLGIVFLTVGFQSVRAALANPVDSLKME